MRTDLQNTYQHNVIANNELWGTYIYKMKEMKPPQDVLDCSFYCKNIEKNQQCDTFVMNVCAKIFF